jgi:hypothetical protein
MVADRGTEYFDGHINNRNKMTLISHFHCSMSFTIGFPGRYEVSHHLVLSCAFAVRVRSLLGDKIPEPQLRERLSGNRAKCLWIML